MREIEASLKELDRVVDCIKDLKKDVILLQGDLATGKTTLVKAFANSLGIEAVSSPTFSIQQIYEGKIFHYDLYNISFEKFMQMGLFEELTREGYHFIEWADEKVEQLLKEIGIEYLIIKIESKEQKRVYRCID